MKLPRAALAHVVQRAVRQDGLGQPAGFGRAGEIDRKRQRDLLGACRTSENSEQGERED